jgi:two-component system, cell cycle response regulator DivK
VSTRILVVEDNSFSREMLCDWLELEGFEVDSAASLSEAVTAVRTARPAAVLLDVQLGPDDGLSLAVSLRQDPELRHVPVIAVTAHSMIAEQERILQAGCNACIPKPVDFDSLREQLNRWLRVAAVLEAGSRIKRMTLQSAIGTKETNV